MDTFLESFIAGIQADSAEVFQVIWPLVFMVLGSLLIIKLIKRTIKKGIMEGNF